MLKTTLGAQLSEILNEEVVAKESGVSRRRVVAGVAWTVPVIATAIAAPAAAASGDASVTIGPAVPITLTGATAASGIGPTSFVIQTGSAFTGSSVSYTLTIESQLQNQKALVAVASVSPGSGTTTTPQNKKNTTFTSSLSTGPGNNTLQVSLTGFNYTETATKGTFTYVVTLNVTVPGASPLVATTTLSITFA